MRRKILQAGIRWFLGGVLREIAEGKRGERAKRAYWWLAGRKTWIGFLAALGGAALAAFAPGMIGDAGPTFVLLGGVLINAGLLDKAWRAEPWAHELAEAVHSVASAGPLLSLCAAGLAQYAGGPWPDRIDVWCLGAGEASAFVAAFLAAPPGGGRG